MMIWRASTRRKQNKKSAGSSEAKEPWGYEFYESMYKSEFDLREKMPARLATSTAITVSIFGALGFMLREYSTVAAFPARDTFWLLFGLSCVSLAWSLYFLARFWWANEYKLMPTAAQLHEHHEALKKHYEPYDGADKLVADAFRRFLLGRYIECATHAADINHLRTARLYKANGGLLIASLIVLCTYAIFVVSTLHIRTPAPQPLAIPVQSDESGCLKHV